MQIDAAMAPIFPEIIDDYHFARIMIFKRILVVYDRNKDFSVSVETLQKSN